jgi:hypothetical protein
MLAFLTVTGFAVAITLLAVLLKGKEALTAANTVDLRVHLEHSLQQGRISVMMDGEILVEETFEGQAQGRRFQGAAMMSAAIPPGVHLFDVLVEGPRGERWSRSVERDLAGGTEATLLVEMKGALRRRLELSWL